MDASTGSTQTYVARAWYRDTATLFNLASFAFLVLSDDTFMQGLPESWQHASTKLIVLFNLWIRFQSSTRPVGLSAGTTREVHMIPLKGTGDGGSGSLTPSAGSVTESTRAKL